jgi:hypothetical protein
MVPRNPPLVTILSPVFSASSMACHFFWRRCWGRIITKYRMPNRKMKGIAPASNPIPPPDACKAKKRCISLIKVQPHCQTKFTRTECQFLSVPIIRTWMTWPAVFRAGTVIRGLYLAALVRGLYFAGFAWRTTAHACNTAVLSFHDGSANRFWPDHVPLRLESGKVFQRSHGLGRDHTSGRKPDSSPSRIE